MPCRCQTRSAAFEHALGATRPGLALPPVGHLVVQPGQIEPPLGSGRPQPQPIAVVAALELRELRSEHHVGFRWGRM